MAMELRDALATAAFVSSAYKANVPQSSSNTAAQSQSSETPSTASVSKAKSSSLKSALSTTTTQDAQEILKSKAEEKKQAEKSEVSPDALKEVLDSANKVLKGANINLLMDYNEEVNVLNIKMIDMKTKEVIKEFPPEEMIDNMIKAREWLGAFIDKMA